MRRGDRLFELIEILRQAGGPISGAQIAAQLEVSPRTVYRDIAALMAQRVPIRGEAGVGYVLEAGFHMPPLMLTADEFEAAVLGAQWVQSRAEPELAAAANSLMNKIAAVAPERLQCSLLEPVTSVAPVLPSTEALSAAQIRLAIRSRSKILLRYRDAQDQQSTRVVWPILLGYRDAGRILAAWCEQRAAYRYFRTERIERGEVLKDNIPRRMAQLRAGWRTAMAAERLRYADQQALTPPEGERQPD